MATSSDKTDCERNPMTDKVVINPLISAVSLEMEPELELSLRPRNLSEYIGQDKIKNNLAICLLFWQRIPEHSY